MRYLFILITLISLEASAGDMPDPELTPGLVASSNMAEVCTYGYSRKMRSVTAGMKEFIYRSYRIYDHKRGDWAIDHLVPLCLGGSNDRKNLWPMYKFGDWGKNRKDQLEIRLCKMACAGALDIKTAQHDIATDWKSAYVKYVSSRTLR